MRCIVALVTAMLVSSQALATPLSHWDRIRDPELERADLALLAARELLERADELYVHGLRAPSAIGRAELSMALEFRRDARALLANASKVRPDDARLLFALGEACEALRDDRCTVNALERAVAVGSVQPEAGHAYFSLAIAYARLGRNEDEIKAYNENLERNADMYSRSTVFSNRAETKMRLGDFVGSISDYQQALLVGGSPKHEALTRWGLAMTYDRAGDLPNAIAEAKRAIARDDKIASFLEAPDVFFIPPYDVLWFRALGEMARASTAPNDKALAHWRMASLEWQRFLDAAKGAKTPDVWVPLAESRKALCDQKIKVLNRSLGLPDEPVDPRNQRGVSAPQPTKTLSRRKEIK